jgi:hypothetical protein
MVMTPAEIIFAINNLKKLISLGYLKLGKNKTEKEVEMEFKAILLGKEPSEYTEELTEMAKKVLPINHQGLRTLRNATSANKDSKVKRAGKKVAAKKVAAKKRSLK